MHVLSKNHSWQSFLTKPSLSQAAISSSLGKKCCLVQNCYTVNCEMMHMKEQHTFLKFCVTAWWADKDIYKVFSVTLIG